MCDVIVLENVIRENQWGGVDIRRGGDPILRNNYICYGYSDGVVVGERGRGLIEGNHVYCMQFLSRNGSFKCRVTGFFVLNTVFLMLYFPLF